MLPLPPGTRWGGCDGSVERSQPTAVDDNDDDDDDDEDDDEDKEDEEELPSVLRRLLPVQSGVGASAAAAVLQSPDYA